MSDLERADRELAALGAVPASLAELVKRYGEADRSISRADAVLAELDNGASPGTSAEPLPPRPSFLPLGWAEQQQTANGTEQSPMPARPNDEITVTSGLPGALHDDAPLSEPPPVLEAELDTAAESIVAQAAEAEASLSEPPAPESAIDEPRAAGDAAQALAEESAQAEEPAEAEEPRISMPLPDSLAPVSAALDPASMRPGSVVSSETYAPRASRPPRPDLARLLDEELDPREFPSSRPPPPGMPVPTPVPALPPVPRVSQSPSDPAPEAESDFELLVDDDDIIEIDEEEN